MAKKLELKECRDGRTFGQCAQEHGAAVKKIGSFLEITTSKGVIHVKDSNRAMPRQEREFVYSLFCKIGLGILVVGLVAGGIAALAG